MKPVMQMRVGWSLASADGRKVQESAYFTPYKLAAIRSCGGGLRRADRRSVAENGRWKHLRTGERRRRTPARAALWLHGVPRCGQFLGFSARPDVERALRWTADHCQPSCAGDRRRRLPAGIDSGADREDRGRLRARRGRHAELRGRADGCADRVDHPLHPKLEIGSPVNPLLFRQELESHSQLDLRLCRFRPPRQIDAHRFLDRSTADRAGEVVAIADEVDFGHA